MKHGLLVAAVIVVVGLVAASQAVNAHAAGMAFPAGSTPYTSSTDWWGSFNWGFYVNIPLIHTFYLTPTAELYKFGDQNATDMAIAFRFIVPLSRFDLRTGVVPGLTAVGDVAAAHVGLLAGTSFQLVSNRDVFVRGKYKWLFQGQENLRVFHLNAGILFNS